MVRSLCHTQPQPLPAWLGWQQGREASGHSQGWVFQKKKTKELSPTVAALCAVKV